MIQRALLLLLGASAFACASAPARETTKAASITDSGLRQVIVAVDRIE